MEGRPLLTRAEMVAADRWTIDELGLPSLVLMEVAGRAVAAATLELGSGPTLAVAGPGNNGADAMVAARHLAEAGDDVSVVALGDEDLLASDARTQLGFLRRLGISVEVVPVDRGPSTLVRRAEQCRRLVDGVFGTGLGRPVTGAWANCLRTLADSGLPTVAVDVPSGLDADRGCGWGPVVPATVTVTFQFPKLGHALHPGRGWSGEVRVVDIGIPPRLLRRLRPQAEAIDPPPAARRSADSHKGHYGHVLAVAGGPDQPGSGWMMAEAALRTGAGLVTVGAVEETVRRLAPRLGPLMGLSLGRAWLDPDQLADAARERTVVTIGPSLPGDARTERVLRAAFGPDAPAGEVPLVLDAGALRALGPMVDGKDGVLRRPGPTVITPHPGEMAGLLGTSVAEVQADRVSAVRGLARATGSVVVLKGASTVVGEPSGRIGVCLRGNPGMATGGAGDVLAGIIAGRWAQAVGAGGAAAARAAVWLHGAAGDRVVRRTGAAGLTAEHLLDALCERGASSSSTPPGGKGAPS
jgi:NAD(P)H-hydrate epimerase